MELGAIIDALYQSEINCSVETFWDGGLTVKLGDDLNGVVAETECNTSFEAAQFLDRSAGSTFRLRTTPLSIDTKTTKSSYNRVRGLVVRRGSTSTYWPLGKLSCEWQQ